MKQWGNNNNGWYEGYYGDIPSTTNGLESSHEKIKDALKGKRLGLIEFLNECRENLIKYWSQKRSKSIKTTDSATNEEIDIDNVNLTEFCKEPNISKSQMLHAYDWNKRSKPIHHIKDNIYMCKGGKDGSLTRQECKQFLTDLDAVPWLQFDQMISSIFNIRIITFNKDNWKLSKCTCCYWLKNYICSHVIACSFRLRLFDFKDIGMDVPIEKKRKIGASRKNLSCYNKQPSDVVQLDEGVIVENDETFDDTSRPNKRAKTVEVEANIENANVNCKKCNEPMKKRRYF